MIFAHIENLQIIEYPLSVEDIRGRFPNTSFPIPFEPPAGYTQVEYVEPPSIGWDQVLKEELPVFVDGSWRQSWSVHETSQEARDNQLNYQSANARSIRNRFLSESDWSQLPDSPVDRQKWAVYRQQLRDVPIQEGFPIEINWPIKP